MKTLRFSPLVNFDGRPIGGEKGITMQDMLCNALGMHKPKDGKESIQCVVVGQKIYGSDDSVDLEDAEWELTKRVLDVNTIGLTAIVLGQLYQVMNAAGKDVD